MWKSDTLRNRREYNVFTGKQAFPSNEKLELACRVAVVTSFDYRATD